MDLERWMADAWEAHAGDPDGVARRLAAEALPALADAPAHAQPGHAGALATLAHHVWGEHLARWEDGRALLDALAALPAVADDDTARAAIARLDASLALCAGAGCEPPAAGAAPDRVRIAALASANLAGRDTPRAMALLRTALDLAATLPDDGPHARALAVTGNNLACTLEEKATRSDDERALMILAAETGRRFWALAGTWLETERAEYRLARTWLAAGDPARAATHAHACLRLVAAHGELPLERFFGWEAAALAAVAGGDAAGAATARAQARAAFDALGPDDQAWCRAPLDALWDALPDVLPASGGASSP